MLQVACIVERSCVEGSRWRRVACGMWQHVTHIYFWHWYFSRSYFQVIFFSLLLLLLRFYSAFAFIFLALTEMERTFPENVVPGWLWSLCAVQRGALQELCVCEGGAGAQDVNHDHLTSLWLIDFRLCLFLSVLRSVLVCVRVCV